MNIPKSFLAKNKRFFFLDTIPLFCESTEKKTSENRRRIVLKITLGGEQKKTIESRKNYLECRLDRRTWFFETKSAVKFIAAALFSLYE